jgi:hypothetical protein
MMMRNTTATTTSSTPSRRCIKSVDESVAFLCLAYDPCTTDRSKTMYKSKEHRTIHKVAQRLQYVSSQTQLAPGDYGDFFIPKPSFRFPIDELPVLSFHHYRAPSHTLSKQYPYSIHQRDKHLISPKNPYNPKMYSSSSKTPFAQWQPNNCHPRNPKPKLVQESAMLVQRRFNRCCEVMLVRYGLYTGNTYAVPNSAQCPLERGSQSWLRSLGGSYPLRSRCSQLIWRQQV